MDSLRARRRNTYYFILLAGLLAIIWASYHSFNTGQRPEKSLGDLLTALDQHQVASGTFSSEGDRVDWIDSHGNHYRTLITAGYASALVDKFHQQSLSIEVTPSSSSNVLLTVILPNLILFVAIGGFMWYMLRQSQRASKP